MLVSTCVGTGLKDFGASDENRELVKYLSAITD